MVFAEFGFKVDGRGATHFDMVHHCATVDAVDRGCFDLPGSAWICLEMASGLKCKFGSFKVSYFGLEGAVPNAQLTQARGDQGIAG